MKFKVLNPKMFVKVVKGPYAQVVDAILNDENGVVIKATKYLSPTLIVRGVRKTYRAYGKKPRKGQNIEITLTMGRPNFVEREFIKLCKKAKEPFPVKRVQLKLFSPTKKKLARKSK